ncbi:MAG: DNA-formamidopyrimidine glycosylase family protein [Faecalibacillus faecis]
MPELPEVETVKRTLENFILNKKIKDIEVIYPKIIDDREEFVQTLKNKTFKEIDRVGKYLILNWRMLPLFLILEWKESIKYVKRDILSKHDHVIFVLDEGMG